MTDYLPKDATIEQACTWLQNKTGQTWILPRLLECHLTPHFWHDYKPGNPAIFGNRTEGYQSRMMFQGDLCRLESDGADALVNMFTAHDGSLIKSEPGLRVPLSNLRFKRDRVERVAEIINNTGPAHSTPATTTATAAPPQRRNRSAKTIAFEAEVHKKFGECLATLRAERNGADPSVAELVDATLAEFDATKYRGGPRPARDKITRHLIEQCHKEFVWPQVVPRGKGSAVRESDSITSWTKSIKMTPPRG